MAAFDSHRAMRLGCPIGSIRVVGLCLARRSARLESINSCWTTTQRPKRIGPTMYLDSIISTTTFNFIIVNLIVTLNRVVIHYNVRYLKFYLGALGWQTVQAKVTGDMVLLSSPVWVDPLHLSCVSPIGI
ncbi:hypothetical protein COLO4_34413 [Corchorus olitorius]|uniref:Uncharacterized protein n=1 Tax=Corchorus olitorius TaxID=93759 RepID=A0A1R3GKX7_9ROSI|nr:hypothetical protein COLO4_34413 [Corchorus olitorius]